jgi:hypothetical protein
VGIITLPPVLSPLTSNVNIRNSGRIATTLPLHVDGRYIKDSLNRTVYLRGVWTGMFADTSTGWFGLDANTWDEVALEYTLDTLKNTWNATCFNTFIWGDWWLQNKNATLMGGNNQTNIGLVDAIKITAQKALEHGLYFQIRLYSPSRAEGRIEGQPYQPTYSWTVQDFTNFWVNVTTTLRNYQNIIYCLFDEPTGDETTWFNAANQTITAIRAAGVNNLILVDYGYCGDVMWVTDWVNGNYSLNNVFFDEHIYRGLGTFAYDNNAPVTLSYIRNFLANPPGAYYTGTGTYYVMNTYNVPIWVAAIGARDGVTDDEEYIAFANTLEALNEFGVGYVAFSATRTDTTYAVQTDPEGLTFSPPNRVGQALINAINGIVPPAVYTLSVNSTVTGAGLQANMTNTATNYTNTYSTPFTLGEFSGNYIISMPSSVKTYTHNPLFGGTTIDGGGSYNFYLYTAGGYTINSSATVSQINLYTRVAGNAKVAIYDSTMSYNYSEYPPNMKYPGNLIVASAEQYCSANTWNTFNITTTVLNAGTYFLAIKTDTTGMLAGGERTWFGDYTRANYADPFPNTFGAIAGGLGTEFAVYIPLTPLIISTNTFSHWENGSTNPVRIINLTTNMTLTATYQTTP